VADTDLLFQQAPVLGSPVDLVFGDDGGEIPAVDAHVAGFITFRRPGATGLVRLGVKAAGAITFVRPGAVGVVRYNSDTDRPLVGGALTFFQDGIDQQTDLRGIYQDGVHTPSAPRVRFQDGARMQASQPVVFEDALRFHNDHATGFQDGVPLGDSARQTFQDADRMRGDHRSGFEDGVKLRWASLSLFQDGLRGSRRFATTRFQDAVPHIVILGDEFGIGAPLWAYLERGRFQDAMRPPPGRSWYPPEPPEPEPCYEPDTNLVFQLRWTASGDLLFMCDYTEPPLPPGKVVVPIKGVYLVINSAVLIRADSEDVIPTLAMSMSLDVDSWTWSFSARVPGEALPLLMPDSNGPVHVEATINGVPYRFIVEKVQRDRSFNSSVVSVSGRGRAAILDAPYAPTRDFMNEEARTSQQLLDDILTDNGISIGWDVEWGLTAWTVPAGVFSHQGTYISAMNAVVQSAGGYLQPHNTDQTVVVNHRYPVLPWDWDDVEPDFEIPSAVATVEGIEWQDLPAYNRVFVSGQAEGVLGRVTRSGTAGDYLAPMVVDPLITHADAARQRGEAILSETGRVASVTLRMPVLALTGIIPPGKFVRYTDGADTRVGIARAVSVDVGLPQVWQTLVLETHE